MQAHPPRPRMFKILCPIEKKDGGGTYWMRLGTAYPNRDQSINLYLDALPNNGRLQLREMDEEDLRRMDEGRARKRDAGGGASRSDDGGGLAAPGAHGAVNDLPF